MTASDLSNDEGYLEVLAASAILDDLSDAARVEAWASSVLGVWGEAPAAADIDIDFVEWLGSSDDPRAPLVLLALSALLDVDAEALTTALAHLQNVPPWFEHLGSAEPTRAWSVEKGPASSVGIGFVLSDDSAHSLLGDIVDGELCSLVVAPGPTELFDGSEDLIAPNPLDIAEAVRRIVTAWQAIAGAPDIPESVYVNSGIARARLANLTDANLDELFRPDPSTSVIDTDVADARDQELDAWAVAQLDMAGLVGGVQAPDILLDAIDPRRIAAYPAAERQAFGALEWADWLGMVIGLSRATVGIHVEPAMLVDQINRCPEVTSSIPRKDRPYFEWAFSMLLPLWRRAKVIDRDDRLTDDGAAMLVDALRTVWAPS